MAATAAVYNRLHSSSLLGGVGGVGSNSSGSGSVGHQTQLARSLERILDEAHHSGELILTNRKLKDFPKTATKYNLTDTVIADLSRNRFCELPEEITTFSFLETLLLYHNTIRNISESVKHLTSLTYLDLRSNQLSLLPREICFLPLQVLLVSNNRLSALPDELGRMDRLTDLDVAYNQLTALPARIGELRSLRSLSLRSNQLMYLPRELTCLTLVSLDVSNNRISSLPLEIRQMTTLVEFNLENNPLTSPPASLCVRGLVHVFKFLETQATKDEKGSRTGGNYDGYTTLRRAPRHNSSGNVLETNRVPRHNVDSGYSTCDGIDKRWSHDMPSGKPKSVSPVRKTSLTPPSTFSVALLDASLSSSTSTIVDEPLSTSSTTTTAAAVVKPLMTNDNDLSSHSPSHQVQSSQPLHQHINYSNSNNSSSSSASPDHEEPNAMEQSELLNHHGNSKSDEKLSADLGSIQTYREYKEALKQQRNLEISSVYKIKVQKTLYDMTEASMALNSNNQQDDNEVQCNGINSTSRSPSPRTSTGGGTTTAANVTSPNIVTTNSTVMAPTSLPKSIMKNCSPINGLNGIVNGGCGTNGSAGSGNVVVDDCVIIPKKPVQKVTPSRYTEAPAQCRLNSSIEMNGGDGGTVIGGYVKPQSPLKTSSNCGIIPIINNNNINASSASPGAHQHKIVTTVVPGIKSPGTNIPATNKLGSNVVGSGKNRVTWNHDIPADKLSFTMRREFDRQREETELMTQLRSIIESRLKMTLPEDIASALTDGVILCHLANYVRPRSVASIHVPSPGVSKLTMARCRRNVENFLEACLKIGVDEELICSCADVVPSIDSDNNDDNEDDQSIPLYNYNDTESENENKNKNDNAVIIERHVVKKEMKKSISVISTLPNLAAVLRTVAALIALDNNPHHQNIRNLQQQEHFEKKLEQYQTHEYEREQQKQYENQSGRQQQPLQHQQLKSHDQFHHYHQHHHHHHACQQHDPQKQMYGCDCGQLEKEQQQKQQSHCKQEQKQQQTATGTKKQLHQKQHEIVANMEFNSTINFQTKSCHNTNNNNTRTNGSKVNGDRGGDDNDCNDYSEDYDDVDGGENSGDGAVDSNVDVNVNVDVDTSYNIIRRASSQHQQQQQQHNGIVGSFLRHAKLKTFQKIKLNLTPTHFGGKNNHHHHVSSMLTTATTTTLQTIAEADNDVISHVTPVSDGIKSMVGDDIGVEGNSGYQLINEKLQKPNNDNNNSAMHIDGNRDNIGIYRGNCSGGNSGTDSGSKCGIHRGANNGISSENNVGIESNSNTVESINSANKAKNVNNSSLSNNYSIKYKLLELPSLDVSTGACNNNDSGQAANKKLVSKRIEFFENSSTSIPSSSSAVVLPSLNNSPDVLLDLKSKVKVMGNLLTIGGSAGGGIGNIKSCNSSSSSFATSNTSSSGVGNIFSIYRSADLVTENNNKLYQELQRHPLHQQHQQQQQQHQQQHHHHQHHQEQQRCSKDKGVLNSTSSLLKHDSHVLTVILSCIFMVTFLLLVFFPLPG